MSKGEIYERINKIFNPDGSGVNAEFHKAMFGDYVLVSQGDITKIYDDAKETFPKKHEPTDWRGNKPAAQYDNAEMDAWFKKYFGDRK